MKGLLRRLRGLLGVGLTWGALWSAIGAGIGLVITIVRPDPFALTNPIFVWALGMGLYGLVSGVGFGSLLSLREGRKTILDLSLRRAAIWGVLGAATVSRAHAQRNVHRRACPRSGRWLAPTAPGGHVCRATESRDVRVRRAKVARSCR